MSSKKKIQRGIVATQEIKYLDNTSIEKYASGDHIMSKSLEPIKSILIREKCKDKNIKFSKELALNLDKVEIESQKGTSYRDSTVDFVLGLENKQLLLIEAKFESKSMDNIAGSISKKIKHSAEMLSSNPNFISLYNKYLILLDSEKFHQNKNRLMSLLNNNPAFCPARVSDFYSMFFE